MGRAAPGDSATKLRRVSTTRGRRQLQQNSRVAVAERGLIALFHRSRPSPSPFSGFRRLARVPPLPSLMPRAGHCRISHSRSRPPAISTSSWRSATSCCPRPGRQRRRGAGARCRRHARSRPTNLPKPDRADHPGSEGRHAHVPADRRRRQDGRGPCGDRGLERCFLAPRSCRPGQPIKLTLAPERSAADDSEADPPSRLAAVAISLQPSVAQQRRADPRRRRRFRRRVDQCAAAPRDARARPASSTRACSRPARPTACRSTCISEVIHAFSYDVDFQRDFQPGDQLRNPATSAIADGEGHLAKTGRRALRLAHPERPAARALSLHPAGRPHRLVQPQGQFGAQGSAAHARRRRQDHLGLRHAHASDPGLQHDA